MNFKQILLTAVIVFVLMSLPSSGIFKQAERGLRFNVIHGKALKNDAEAEFDTALAYHEGDGVKKNTEKAVYWYTKSAESGFSAAQYILSIIYFGTEEEIPENIEVSRYWDSLASKNYKEVKQTLQIRARENHKVAQYALGWFLSMINSSYIKYYDVPMNSFDDAEEAKGQKLALKWFEKAAKLGHANAQLSLAESYCYGTTLPKDYKKAFYWYLRSAKQGNSISQYNVADFYSEGKGVPQNYSEAYYWYSLAASKGDSDTKVRDNAAQKLNSEQLALLQEKASNFNPKIED